MHPTLLASPGISGKAFLGQLLLLVAPCAPSPGLRVPCSGAGWTDTAPTRLGEPLNPSSNQRPALAGCCVRGTWEQGEGLKFLMETARSLT